MDSKTAAIIFIVSIILILTHLISYIAGTQKDDISGFVVSNTFIMVILGIFSLASVLTLVVNAFN
jgi:hypothetical protein